MQTPTDIYRVYKHTSISNKGYIGYTKLLMMERWSEELTHSRNKNHKWKIDKAIRKYPEENQWNHNILIDNIPNLEEAKRLEIEMIALYDTYKNGYNSTPGGDGSGPCSEETRRKKSESGKNKLPPTEETRKKIAEVRSLTWQITYPNGETKIIKNLNQFCRENNLNVNCMYHVSQGKHKQHKRFKCIKIS
jgi:hypothetical protein